MRGRLEGIWIKRSHRGPMDPQQTSTVITGKGLAGNADNSRTRQVTIIEREVWERVTDLAGTDAGPSRRRANLMVTGISLADSRGRLLRIGLAFRIVRLFG